MAFPMELCDGTVTVYRPREGQIFRQVTKAFYHYRDVWTGERFCREFLLVLPQDITILPGDRIWDGVGPEEVDWERFLPVSHGGLSQVGKAGAYRVDGKLHHWEATH